MLTAALRIARTVSNRRDGEIIQLYRSWESGVGALSVDLHDVLLVA